MNLILFILICYGLTQILTAGKIFDKIRPKHHYFHCSMCVGMPVGIIVFLLFYFCGLRMFPNIYIGSFLFGCLSSGTSFLLQHLFDEDGMKINIK